MPNNFRVEPKNGEDVMITVNGKSVIILRGNLADLCRVETIGPFLQKLKESVLGSPEEMVEFNDALNSSNSERLHNMMDEIKKFCD